MKTSRLVASAVVAVIAASAVAQSPVEVNMENIKKSHKIVNVDGAPVSSDSIDDNERELLDVFYYNQFRNYQDARAPYFLFLSKNNKMAMGIGGTVKMQAWGNWNGTLSGSDFIPYDIAVPKDPASSDEFATSFGGSKIFLTLFGKHNKIGNYQVYIAAKFNGGGKGYFKLNKAYAILGDWTFGYANSTFTDPAAQPNTVDPQGPNAEISDTNVLLRYMHEFKNGMVVAASVETPDADIPSQAGMYAPCTNVLPNVAAFIQYQWGGGQHVRLSGVARTLRYRNLIQEDNHKKIGWGAHLSTVFRPVDPLTIYGSVEVGKGISSLVNDLQNDPMDLVPCVGDNGTMKTPLSYGWYAAVQYNFRPNIYSSLVFGEERFSPDNRTMTENPTYKYGIYATANVFWEITSRCTTGIEYNFGRRQNYDSTHGIDNRISLMASFSF